MNVFNNKNNNKQGSGLRGHESGHGRERFGDHGVSSARLDVHNGRAVVGRVGRVDGPQERLCARQGRLHAYVRQEFLRRQRHCRRPGILYYILYASLYLSIYSIYTTWFNLNDETLMINDKS